MAMANTLAMAAQGQGDAGLRGYATAWLVGSLQARHTKGILGRLRLIGGKV